MSDQQEHGYTVKGPVELFDRPGGWHFVRVPQRISDELEARADRGVIAIRAATGESEWDSSLLPMGDGSHFIALSKAVRGRNSIDLGQTVTVRFSTR